MAYTISRTETDDARGAVLELWQRNLPDTTPDRYAWLYERGPADCWLLSPQPGDVVGSAGIMGRSLSLAGRSVQAGQAIDLNVDREHRTAGPALALQRAVTGAVQAGRFDLLYGFPNAESEAVLARAGYRPLGRLERWVKPLCSEDGIEGWLKSPRLRKATSAVFDLALVARSPETYYQRRGGVRVEISDRFDARFDRLWQRAAGQFGVVGERTSRYLNWRFAQSPLARHRAFCLCAKDRELQAYLVYSRDEAKVFVGDFFFTDLEALDTLLAEFARFARREKARSIATLLLGGERVCRKLARFGFVRRPSTWRTLVYFDPACEKLDGALLSDPQAWFLTRADVDTDEGRP